MKKLFLILLLPMLIFAQADMVKSRLLSEISRLIIPNEKVKIYVKSPEFLNILKTKDNYVLVDECKEANLILVEDIDDIPKECQEQKNIIFVTSYSEYKDNDNTVGAIFWQKGRLNLIFRKKRLDDLSIHLPESYSNYVE